MGLNDIYQMKNEDCKVQKSKSNAIYYRHRLHRLTQIFKYMKDNIYIGKKVLVVRG